ncbi:hypothetical protein FJT64_016275 [Amphibalanus amphitrite]|uniref:Uncharacterized protein n=1 Tax=Amphibalanus amphitrite TaxID=1232801 RepID=A0A6A4XAZ7_AMPAM|nr:hypothetical protein FJT64_016275 [Amphibalanus amphitrite]
MAQLRLPDKKAKLLDWLATKCGSALHLLPDTLLLATTLRGHHPIAHQADVLREDLADAVRWLLQEPIIRTLLDLQEATCRYCEQSCEQLSVVHLNRCGLSDQSLFMAGSAATKSPQHEMMMEFGPLHWTDAVLEEEEPDCVAPQGKPQVWARPTDTPGFVTLHWTRTTRCEHEGPLEALRAGSIRQLTHRFCRVMCDGGGVVTVNGPAVQVGGEDTGQFGVDHVPCLRAPWWPAKEKFLGRHQVTEFPPPEVRENMCRFGVHLVPVSKPGRAPEDMCWQVSFARALVVAIRYLSPLQVATIEAVKAMQVIDGESVVSGTALKSSFIINAVLWLVQDTKSDLWTSITGSVQMVLDWLERKLSKGRLSCFFYEAMDLAEGLSGVARQDMLDTIELLKSQSTQLLAVHCVETLDLVALLGEETEPLSERQLRLRLAQHLIISGVSSSIVARKTAPWWHLWFIHIVPNMIFDIPLVNWYHRCISGTYTLQCLLLQAWSVLDPADLVNGDQETESYEGTIMLDATPLTRLLSKSQLEFLLGDAAAVAAWCRRQLRRPEEERPAGLTAELDAPRGRAELLLRPELLLQAISKAVPKELSRRKAADHEVMLNWRPDERAHQTYQDWKVMLEERFRSNLKQTLRDCLPELDSMLVASAAGLWKRHLQDLLSSDHLQAKYTEARCQGRDNWQLRPLLIKDPPAEGEDAHKQRRQRVDKRAKQPSDQLTDDRANQQAGQRKNPEADQRTERNSDQRTERKSEQGTKRKSEQRTERNGDQRNKRRSGQWAERNGDQRTADQWAERDGDQHLPKELQELSRQQQQERRELESRHRREMQELKQRQREELDEIRSRDNQQPNSRRRSPRARPDERG